MRMGIIPYVALLVWCVLPARADRVADLARVHLEVVGGNERIQALKTLKATGRVLAEGQELRFELLAERPNRVRVTTRGGGRVLVQGTDGIGVPWTFEPMQSAVARAMSERLAREFAADAEFDDPLINSVARGFVLEYGGEMEVAGVKYLEVLVTHRAAEPSVLLVDPETYFIVQKRVERVLPSGRKATIETRYDDFRPVAGVFLPYRIEVWAEGRRLHQTLLEEVQANPKIESGAFAMPVGPRRSGR